MTYPSSPAAIEAELNQLAVDFPGLVTRFPAANASPGGKTISYVHVTARPVILTTPEIPVLVTGGHHAREYAPPDALLTFVRRLLTAYKAKKPIRYGRVTAPSPPGAPLVFDKFSISPSAVKKMVDVLDLYILPCVNPDGREFSMSTVPLWRKTRHPVGTGTCTNPFPPPPTMAPTGTDPNRNYDFAFDFDAYYSAAFVALGQLRSSKDPCNFSIYIGPGAGTALRLLEPEVDNVQKLVDTLGIKYFLDIHSCAQSMNYPWAAADNQSTTPSQNFQNHSFDRVPPTTTGAGGRDFTGGAYGEFFPNAPPLTLLDRHTVVVEAMRDKVVANAGAQARARAQCKYFAGPAPGGVAYYSSGTCTDYAFSRQFLPGAPVAPIYSFLIESGSRDLAIDGGFQPTAAQFPKVEREIHAALAVLLDYAATWG